MNLRLAAFALVGAAAALGSAASLAQTSPSGPVPPPPPTPVPVLAPSVAPPTFTPPPGNRKRAAAAKPNATDTPNSGTARTLPSPPTFANLTGIWEVAIQPGGALTLYSHLQLQQGTDNSIAGYWELQNKKKLPLNGTFDGKQFKFTVTDGKKQETFAGYQDGFSDMVGLADMGDGKKPVAFTAEHRAKQNFINNLQIGVPGAAGGSAPGGGVGPGGL